MIRSQCPGSSVDASVASFNSPQFSKVSLHLLRLGVAASAIVSGHDEFTELFQFFSTIVVDNSWYL